MVFGPSGAFWDCFNSGGHETSQVPVCTGSGNYTVVRVKSLPCWNGQLDSADHRSHMSGMNGGVCPSDHPIKVPQINFFQRYPVGVGGPGVHFSDGSILPHVDFWNTWNQAALVDLVNRCLRQGINCGQVGG